MKILLVVLVVLLGVAGYVAYVGKDAKPEVVPSEAVVNTPLWQQPIPEGAKLVEEGLAKIHVKPVRRNEGNRNWMDFHITEEHGYMVDGITVRFWYRFKDKESGDWIDDVRKIDYFVKKRLGFNETLVESTPLMTLEFEHLGPEVAVSTGENWNVQVVKYSRAMEPAGK